MLTQIIGILAWLAAPFTLIAVVDDWFLRPRRQAAALAAANGPAANGAPVTADPPLIALIYYVLPVLLLAAVLRLLGSERLDFSLVLVLIVLVAGVIWLLDRLVLAPVRARAAIAAGKEPATISVPVTVDYARSFLPVAVVVLVVRSFIFEPFRIPSDSMMPTLLDGDFIIVNKFAYGLRLPVLNTKILDIGPPQRGDVVVFRYPPDPAINYIKRLAGLPGDRIRIESDQIYVNGQPLPLNLDHRYDDGCYHNMRLSTELIGAHKHQVLSCLTPDDFTAPPSSSCNRRMERNYQCEEPGDRSLPDRGDIGEIEVPPGQYLMIGDNRDNSADGRYFGFVPEDHLVGKATRIWFNWDLRRSGGPLWSRIGHRIE
jgi:signal peptidase I